MPFFYCFPNLCMVTNEWFTIFKRIHEVWMPRTLQKNVWLLKLLFVKVAFDPIRKGPPLWNFGISDKLYFFAETRYFSCGKKRTALFQTRNWEKSSFFTTLIYIHMCTPLYANTWQRGTICPPPVLIGLINLCYKGYNWSVTKGNKLPGHLKICLVCY